MTTKYAARLRRVAEDRYLPEEVRFDADVEITAADFEAFASLLDLEMSGAALIRPLNRPEMAVKWSERMADLTETQRTKVLALLDARVFPDMARRKPAATYELLLLLGEAGRADQVRQLVGDEAVQRLQPPPHSEAKERRSVRFPPGGDNPGPYFEDIEGAGPHFHVGAKRG